MVVFFILAWIRATFPRLRIDQMMSFCWKFLVPLVLVLFMVVAIVLKLELPAFVEFVVLVVLNVAILVAGFVLLGRALRKAAYAPKRAFTPELPRL